MLGNRSLREERLRAYEALKRMLEGRLREDELEAMDNALRELPDDKFLLLVHHLYPEITRELGIAEDIEELRKEAIRESTKFLRVERSRDGSIVLVIDA